MKIKKDKVIEVLSGANDKLLKASLLAGLRLFGFSKKGPTSDDIIKAAKKYDIDLSKFPLTRGHGVGLFWSPVKKVVKQKLSKRLKFDWEEDGGDGYMFDYLWDDYEYVFFPKTGKGLDANEYSLFDKKLKAKDGKVYVYWGTRQITILTIDTTKEKMVKYGLKLGLQEEDLRAEE